MTALRPGTSAFLAATDFSRRAEAALRRAAALARLHNASLEILHVVPHTLVGDTWALLADYWRSRLTSADADRARALAADRLGETAAALAAETGLPVARHLAEGQPAQSIAARAAALGAELLVVGAHGEHGLRELFAGSTMQKLLHLAGCPVLVIRQWPVAPYDEVLLPTDFSAPALEAARVARRLFPGVRPCLFHAYELPYESLMRYAAVAEETIEAQRRDAGNRLREALAGFAHSAGFAPDGARLRIAHGYPPVRLLEAAQDLNADLIVIATHGRSGLAGALLGSVALRVALEARCDVLFVRPPFAGAERAGAGAPAAPNAAGQRSDAARLREALGPRGVALRSALRLRPIVERPALGELPEHRALEPGRAVRPHRLRGGKPPQSPEAHVQLAQGEFGLGIGAQLAGGARVVAREQPLVHERFLHARQFVAACLVERPVAVQILRLDRLVAHRGGAVVALQEEVARGDAPVRARAGEPAVHVALRIEAGERTQQTRAARRVGEEHFRVVHRSIAPRARATRLTPIKRRGSGVRAARLIWRKPRRAPAGENRAVRGER